MAISVSIRQQRLWSFDFCLLNWPLKSNSLFSIFFGLYNVNEEFIIISYCNQVNILYSTEKSILTWLLAHLLTGIYGYVL